MTSPLERMIWASDVPIAAKGPKGCAQRCLLQTLARRVGVQLRCQIGQHRLRETTGLCNEAMVAALQALEDQGLIKRTPRYGPDPKTGKIKRLTDTIRLLIAENPLPLSPAEECDPDEDDDVVHPVSVSTPPSVHPDFSPVFPDFGAIEPKSVTQKEGLKEGLKEGVAREAIDDLFELMPERSRRNSSLKQWRIHWCKVTAPPSRAAMAEAVRAYAADRTVRHDLAHFWLSQDLFREYLNRNATTGGEPIDWAWRVSEWRKQRMWLGSWGPTPLERGCLCPPEFLDA